MELKFWSGRRVMVTGHTGFKGSWLSLWLQQLGAEVFGYGLPPGEPSLFAVADVGNAMQDLRGDIRDLDKFQSVMRICQPEVLFHLAAQPLVRASYQQPVATYEVNVMGTVHVLEAARSIPCLRSVVVITSDKCYENQNRFAGYREEEPMGGHDPYSSSKGCAELVVSAYRRSFFAAPSLPRGIATGRAGNVIGGGDWAADRLVPDILRALSQGSEVQIRNPLAVRPWQHVLEPIYGYLLLGERLWKDPHDWSEGWNFGPSENDTLPVGEIVQKMIKLWGSGSWRADQIGNAVHEAHQLRLNCQKSNERLGWQPQFDIHQALKLTVEWFHEFQAGRAREATLRQISAYQIASTS